ncbi:unnamed protein product [Leptidea sinapis]|uniref:Evolutionarily conserved signaling intermediate in Toll pathway, mitochondrial n=1 Tax=Leptidea sinapis TaxID=189913 RepID=A0A5E4QSX5_9NEOP|nr:unnamed protein product [Leptidea sinapis]
MAANLFKNILNVRSSNLLFKKWKGTDKSVIIRDPFGNRPQKTKDSYLQVIKMFEDGDPRRRGHVEFIYAALSRMKEFGVQKDLEVYKALIDVLPKGKFIPTNIFQAEFLHYPKQQQCAVDLLEQMEDNAVMPDIEMEQMLLNTFGRRGIPLRKYWRMMYWMPKFKNLSPWYLPDELPRDVLELSKLAIARITSVDPDTKINVWQTEEIQAAIDKTWIISAQSRTQQVLLAEQPLSEPLIIKGPYNVYLRDQVVTYFTLLGKLRQEPKDDINLDGTSSRDSLLSWIRLLEKNDNPLLANVPVIFTLLAPSSDVSLHESPDAIPDDKTQIAE